MEKVADIFDGLVGQTRAKEFLGAAFGNHKLPQTMIFVGPAGVGRKTAAMMLARALHEQGQGSPSVPRGLNKESRHPDTFIFSEVLEELRAQEQSSPIKKTADAAMKFLGLSPIASKTKVAIIDDADELSEDSQNALLKTLEEPLPDSILILISGDEQRLLPTIVSRAQIVRFGPLSDELIREAMSEATDAMLSAAQGSLGLVKAWLAEPERFAEVQAMREFWANAERMTTEEKIVWTERIKERTEVVRFLEEGLRVWRAQWLLKSDPAGDQRLEGIQTAIRQVKDNVNPRVAMEVLLLSI